VAAEAEVLLPGGAEVPKIAPLKVAQLPPPLPPPPLPTLAAVGLAAADGPSGET
jgi:hypothetical protein